MRSDSPPPSAKRLIDEHPDSSSSASDRPNNTSEPKQVTAPAASSSSTSSAAKIFPDWAVKAWTLKTLKTMIRVLVVYIACHALLFSQATLNILGQAAFFSVMVSVMLPPSMAVSLFMLVATTLLMGMLIGWAWGCAAMAAGLKARNQVLFQSQYLKAQTTIQSNPDATFRGIVFEGAFLDAQVSAVYGVFFFFGTFFFGWIRASKPKLSLLAIFGTIVIDVMCSYGPLFPTAQYKLVTIFLLPTSCYVAIALASIVLIFPESMSHVWIGGANKAFFQPSIGLLALQESILSSSYPLDTAAFSAKVEKSKAIRRGVVAGSQAILGLSGIVDLELSVGKLGPADLQTISSRIKALVPKTLALVSYATFVADVYEHDRLQEASFGGSSHSPTTSTYPPAAPSGMQTPSRFSTLRKQMKEREERLGHDLSILLPILHDSSLPLRTACSDAVKDMSAWLETLNESRWKLGKKGVDLAGEETAKERVDALKRALREFRQTERDRLVKGPFAKFFDLENGGEKGGLKPEYKAKAHDTDVLAARSLFLCFVFTTTLEAYADSLLDFFSYTVELRQRRRQSRLWAPSGFGKIWRKINSRHGPGSDPLGSSAGEAQRRIDSDSIDEDDVDEADVRTAEEVKDRNPDVSPTLENGKRSKLSNFFRWFKGVEGLFALRHATISMVLWIIAVHPTTAAFNYRNRGLWALIMAQTGLGLYAGDMISQFIFRFGGTAVGLVLGMVAWYIGAGRGNGNPYGLTAISCLLAAPILYARISLPQEKLMACLMAGITMTLIVGYSWIDTHIPVTASAGVGVDVAWRRALLVLIGFAAAFVISCFPRITSARVTVRKTAANLTEKIGALFASEVEALLLEEKRVRPTNEAHKKLDDEAKEKRIKSIGARWLKIAEQLQGIVPVCDNAKLEPHIRGPWPREKYEKLFALQWKLLIAISILSGAFAELNVQWTSTLVRKTPFLNANLLSDIFTTLSLLASSLKNSHPLPAALPCLRERLVYHQRHARAHMPSSAFQANLDDEEMDTQGAESIRGSSIGIKELTMEVMTDPQLPLHSTAVVALSSIITVLDELTDVTRSLVGEETSFQGFEDWRSRNVRYEEEGIRREQEKVQ